MRVLLTLFALAFLGVPVMAQDKTEVIFVNSDPVVAVHSNFRGQAITLFGSIEPGNDLADGPLGVAVVVQGPSSDWVVREKSRQFGLVLNSQSIHYDSAPTYYAIFSSGPVSQLAEPDVIDALRLNFEGVAASYREADAPPDADAEFVRLMLKSGNFIAGERNVIMHSRDAFSVRVPIGSDAANGSYLARAMVFSGGKVVADATTRFSVRTQGFERYVAETARRQPVLYGLAAIALALFTGWLGGVLFKR